MIVAGIGFSSGATAAEIVALVRRAETLAEHAAEILAAPDFKSDAACLREAAQILGLPVQLVDRATLGAVQKNCPTQSQAAAREVGLASVAEACALAGAGAESHLLVARLTQGNVTCALAGDLP